MYGHRALIKETCSQKSRATDSSSSFLPSTSCTVCTYQCGGGCGTAGGMDGPRGAAPGRGRTAPHGRVGDTGSGRGSIPDGSWWSYGWGWASGPGGGWGYGHGSAQAPGGAADGAAYGGFGYGSERGVFGFSFGGASGHAGGFSWGAGGGASGTGGDHAAHGGWSARGGFGGGGRQRTPRGRGRGSN